MSYLNLSGYHFKPLENLSVIKAALLEQSKELELRGTVLLAPEGINLFLSGPKENCQKFITQVCETLVISEKDLELKPSYSDHLAFNRFLIRIKKETIAFDCAYNHDHAAPYVSPTQLDEWLSNTPDDIVLVDTRNTYETDFGAFSNAIIPQIHSFKEFKPFVETLHHLKNKKIVTYCTGGIRCEKAATFMKEQGFNDVYQLQGGILRYFEESQALNYDGECFVFDKRVSLKPDLTRSDKKLCHACRSPLTAEDYSSEYYIENEQCPYCIKKGKIR